MLSDYTFLTDHSYSLRPVVDDDNDELSLNKREETKKKRRRSSSRTNQTTSATNRTVSIDRSSSDKENNSLILSSSNKKKSIGSRASRLSTRTAMTNSRKKQDNKKSSIIKKKKVINRGKTKLLNISQLDSNDVLPSLSIEERVKLRRTKPLQPSTIVVEKKLIKNKKSQNRSTKIPTVQEDIKQIRQSIKLQPTKNTKLFLGSGLDLDNIVLGNRQRRCVQT